MYKRQIPACLQDGHYAGARKMGRAMGYQYPHDFPNHYVRQQYLPDELKDRVYYTFGSNKTEQMAAAYRAKIQAEAAPEETSSPKKGRSGRG